MRTKQLKNRVEQTLKPLSSDGFEFELDKNNKGIELNWNKNDKVTDLNGIKTIK